METNIIGKLESLLEERKLNFFIEHEGDESVTYGVTDIIGSFIQLEFNKSNSEDLDMFVTFYFRLPDTYNDLFEITWSQYNDKEPNVDFEETLDEFLDKAKKMSIFFHEIKKKLSDIRRIFEEMELDSYDYIDHSSIEEI